MPLRASFSGKALMARILSVTLGGNNGTMEDVLKFLVIIAVIAVGIVKQYNKEARKKNTTAAPAGMPPVPEDADTDSPLPPHRTTPEAEPFIPRNAPAQPETPQPRREVRPTAAAPKPPIPPADGNADTDYAIRSAEDARRAIVWSEILKRKYD